MESIKKYKKLTLALIFIIFIAISTHVGAYSQTFSPTSSNIDGNGHFNPYKADGSLIFYCIQHGSAYKGNLPSGYTEGSTDGSWCELANKAPSAPWSGKKYTMTYNYEETVVDRNYQDAAYVIASAVESNQISDMGTQWSIWATTLNIGKSDTNKGTWGNEAVEYRNFYNNIHSGTTDIYKSKLLDKTNINSVNVYVDQNEKTYIVGPFTVEYPIGEYGTQKWSYITNITLLNQENVSMGNVTSNTIHIVDSNGAELKDSINNNNFPNSNESFYVKFSSTLGNMDNIKLKVDFKYLESCSAILRKYDGALTSWYWQTVSDGICTDASHKHKGTQAVKYTWKLTKKAGGKPQKLVAYDGDGKKNYQTASLIVAPGEGPGIDLTMKIAGQVFLDRDSGKVNTGNNIMDGNNEALPGVEVVLYYANGNLKDQIVTKTSNLSRYHKHTDACYQNVDHVHTGDPYVGGGCYTVRIHTHIGDWENGGRGTCYETPIKHEHTGNENGITTVHHHTDACYEAGHTHGEDCYGEGTCTISNVELRTGQASHTQHCEKCREITSCTSHVYWEHHSICGEKEAGGYLTCNVCGSRTYTWDSTGSTGSHKVEAQLICELEETSTVKKCEYEEGQVIKTGYGCYIVPVYHTHTAACYTSGGSTLFNREEGNPYDGHYRAYLCCGRCGWYELYYESMTHAGHTTVITDKRGTIFYCPRGCRGENRTCGYNQGDIEKFSLGCGVDSNNPFVYTLSCDKKLFTTGCDGKGSKVLICDKSNQVENTFTNVLQNPVVTDNNGYYEFDGISAFDESGNPLKYYVKYVYNGMLYTNVLYNDNNADNVSKADETSRFNYRTGFNNQFAEIGSYPSNYKIVNKVFGNDLGDYNKVYLQEDVASIYKKISEKMVGTNSDSVILANACNKVYNDLQSRYSDKTELKRMIQFAADCRISAFTVKNYPLIDRFIISDTGKKIGNVWYSPIYSGTYNQLHVNLGIKARPTFDLALYKDVLKAEVQINGKTEIYNYDARKQSSTFKIGISEENYLNGLRSMYQSSNSFTNTQRINGVDADAYVLGMRNEEVANGQSSKYNASTLNNNYKANNDYSLTGDDRLKVFVTYKIAITNQSSIIGAATEVVDYYDPNYNFVEAYIGNANGNKTGDVTKSDTSIYGSEFKSTKNAYKTMYLRPNVEKRLYNNDIQYMYVKFELVGPANDVGTLLSSKLLNNDTLNVMNLAEINGYKTYEGQIGAATPGLIDIDSNPGNLNISNISALTQDNLVNYPNITSMYEDDTSRAPTIIYKISESKTIEGTVFEDLNKNGILDNGETGINGVVVDLIEIKNGQMVVRATTKTNGSGWYGFTGFVPGNYTLRYTYGSDDDTAMTTNSVYYKGLNAKSYNGQDYQSTYKTKVGVAIDRDNYKPLTDAVLIDRYTINKNNKNSEESVVPVTNTTKIDKYNDGYYWYTIDDKYSDARDDEYRVSQVVDYSRKEYGTEITNHKAEVFSSFENPQPDHIKAADNRQLASELERRTYRYAYTPVLEVEIEYATKNVTGNVNHIHNIKGVDFGITLRPKSELTIDQDIKHIKVTLTNGQVIFDTENGTNDVPNLQWINPGKINIYDKNELLNAIVDEELMNGAKLEIIYNITVKNNSDSNTGITRAKNIINYVSNNLNFDAEENNGLWEVVSKDSIQNGSCSTLINKKSVDLSTQSVILKASNSNPLVSTNLNSGEQVTTELKLKKILSTESTSDDLRYTNMTEIVEIENTIGRYDHGAIPGNQKLNLNPCEHDTSGASRYTDLAHDPDGVLVVTPPTGSNYNYYVYIAIGITAVAILGVGVFLIKKHVIK